jgi:hypothetical protein
MSEAQQQPTGVPDGWEVVAPAAAPTPRAGGRDFKILGVNIHVPGEEKPRADANVIGWGSQGAGVAPEDLLMGGMMARGVARAASGGAGAAVKAAVAEASPLLKYEVTKTTLEKMRVPAPIAMLVAAAVSGYRGNGKKPAVPEVPPVAEPRVPANATGTGWTPAPMPTPSAAAPRASAPVAAPSGTPSPAPPAPAPPATPPTAQEMAAQTLTRQGYSPAEAQAAVAQQPPAPAAATTSPAAPTAPKPMLLAADFAAVQRLTSKGMPLPKAIAQVQAERALAERLGLPSPEQARQSVADRNKTGRWKKDE